MTSTSVTDASAPGIKRLSQHLGALIASLGGFALGVSLAWNSNVVEVFRKNLDANAAEIGLIAAVFNAGASLGAFIMPFALKYVSHISIMSLTLPVFILGWLFISLGSQKVLHLIIGRILCGISGGAFCILTPVFVAEIAHKKMREQLLTYFQLLINCGIMYAFTVAHFLNESDTIWRYSLLCMLPCSMILLVHFLPNSPLFHLQRDDEFSSKKSLECYRSHEVEQEIAELKRLVVGLSSQKISTALLRKRSVIQACLTCLVVILTQQLCGINTMIFYAQSLFDIAGSGELTGSELTLIVGAVQILSCLLASILLDVLSRRILLVLSYLLMGLFLILLGWFYYVRSLDPEYDDIYFWMPPTWIGLFFAAYNLGVGPVSWSLLGDVLPMKIQLPVAATLVSSGWLLSFVENLYFVNVVMTLGIPRLLCVSAAVCWLVALVCAFITPNNKGKSLVEIQDNFHVESEENDTSVET